jgi:hypothetical protein
MFSATHGGEATTRHLRAQVGLRCDSTRRCEITASSYRICAGAVLACEVPLSCTIPLTLDADSVITPPYLDIYYDRQLRIRGPTSDADA